MGDPLPHGAVSPAVPASTQFELPQPVSARDHVADSEFVYGLIPAQDDDTLPPDEYDPDDDLYFRSPPAPVAAEVTAVEAPVVEEPVVEEPVADELLAEADTHPTEVVEAESIDEQTDHPEAEPVAEEPTWTPPTLLDTPAERPVPWWEREADEAALRESTAAQADPDPTQDVAEPEQNVPEPAQEVAEPEQDVPEPAQEYAAEPEPVQEYAAEPEPVQEYAAEPEPVQEYAAEPAQPTAELTHVVAELAHETSQPVAEPTQPYAAEATQPYVAAPAAQGAWWADYSGRFEYRWHDGREWTAIVASHGSVYTDPWGL